MRMKSAMPEKMIHLRQRNDKVLLVVNVVGAHGYIHVRGYEYALGA